MWRKRRGEFLMIVAARGRRERILQGIEWEKGKEERVCLINALQTLKSTDYILTFPFKRNGRREWQSKVEQNYRVQRSFPSVSKWSRGGTTPYHFTMNPESLLITPCRWLGHFPVLLFLVMLKRRVTESVLHWFCIFVFKLPGKCLYFQLKHGGNNEYAVLSVYSSLEQLK